MCRVCRSPLCAGLSASRKSHDPSRLYHCHDVLKPHEFPYEPTLRGSLTAAVERKSPRKSLALRLQDRFL